MSPRSWTLLAGTAALIAACQAAPPVGPAPSPGATTSPGAPPPTASAGVGAPTVGPSAAASGAAPASPAVTPAAPSPTAAPSREVVLGSIYNDNGGLVERAKVVIDADDDAFDRTIDAAGGAYAMRDVPVGTSMSITAMAPGYSWRTRFLKVRQPIPFADEEPNRVDFGGPSGPGFWYFLTDYPEITRTTPDNLSKDVPVDKGLDVEFRFSDAIAEADQGRFERLVLVTVPAPSGVSGLLSETTALGGARLRFDWSEGGAVCRMRFELPIVVRIAGAAITVELDKDVPIEEWPKGVSGKRLGFEKVALTVDGSGSKRTNRIAGFARRPTIDEPVPTDRPSPDIKWGTTHMTSMRFEARRDLAPPRVTKAVALAGNAGEDDVIALTFDKPIFGFPGEAALSEETRRPANFGLVYGRTTENSEREKFEASDPATTGGIPSNGVDFDPRDPYTLYLHDAPGSFGDGRRFKLFVNPKVEDVYGAAVGGAGQHLEGDL